MVYPGVELGHRSVTRRRATSCNVIGGGPPPSRNFESQSGYIPLVSVQAHNKNMCDIIVILYPYFPQVG